MGEIRITEQTEAAALAGSEQLPVAQLSSTVFRTGTTISASSVGNVLYDSANGWLAAGLAGNQQVNVSGWTGGSVANNIDSATIVSVTANALYLDVALTSASAGDTVTVRRWMPRKVSLAGRLKTYFDALYQAAGTYLTPGAITGSGLTMATARLLGRSTAATGAVEEITVGSGLSLSGGTLSANAVDAGAVTYTPADNTDWAGSADPGDVDNALDQLAMRVKDVEGAGTGDVAGPASAVNNSIAVFDGTTGKIIKDGGATVASLDTATQTHAASSKATPVDADEVPLVDSAASNVLKRLTWANLKATLKTYFDTLYDGRTFSVGFGFTSTPTASEVLLLYTFAEAVTFPDEWSGSVGDIGTNPTASFVLTVQKNGSSVGTVTISTGGAFTFVTTGTTVAFAIGDQIRVVGPATPDATAANVSITFLGAK